LVISPSFSRIETWSCFVFVETDVASGAAFGELILEIGALLLDCFDLFEGIELGKVIFALEFREAIAEDPLHLHLHLRRGREEDAESADPTSSLKPPGGAPARLRAASRAAWRCCWRVPDRCVGLGLDGSFEAFDVEVRGGVDRVPGADADRFQLSERIGDFIEAFEDGTDESGAERCARVHRGLSGYRRHRSQALDVTASIALPNSTVPSARPFEDGAELEAVAAEDGDGVGCFHAGFAELKHELFRRELLQVVDRDAEIREMLLQLGAATDGFRLGDDEFVEPSGNAFEGGTFFLGGVPELLEGIGGYSVALAEIVDLVAVRDEAGDSRRRGPAIAKVPAKTPANSAFISETGCAAPRSRPLRRNCRCL
jgi:hypothetical protein